MLATRLIQWLFGASLMVSALSYANDETWANWQEEPISPVTFNSHFRARLGQWLANSNHPSSWSAQSAMLRLGADYHDDRYQLDFKMDLNYSAADNVLSGDVRTLALKFDLADLGTDSALLNSLGLKVGRQSLSWGVGDFVFINDLFAKNWQAFFDGSDIQYLKQPNDALKLSYYGNTVGLDVVYLPQSNSDILIVMPPQAIRSPSGGTTNARLYFSDQQTDFALYASDGVSSSPVMRNGQMRYAKRRSLGASAVMPLASGLLKFELGRYWDEFVTNHSIENDKASQRRYLIAYEFELRPRLTLTLQAYQENDVDDFAMDDRQLVTAQFSYLSQDSLWNSQLMSFYSPNHHDNYLRLTSTYRHNDHLSLTFGANTLAGEPQSFFGRLSTYDNAYLRVTYYF